MKIELCTPSGRKVDVKVEDSATGGFIGNFL